MKYRKKPVVIEAIKFTKENIKEAMVFIGNISSIDYIPYSEMEQIKYYEYIEDVRENGLKIRTLEGEMTTSFGDYIIKGVNGEFYPCKPDIFEKTYEVVVESQGLDFGLALAALKNCHKVARKGWNGKGMFVYYVPAAKYEACTEIGESIADDDNKVSYEPYLAIKNVKGTVSTWVPSINDCLADDWEVVD